MEQIDMIGKTFGRLTSLGMRSGDIKGIKLECMCSCGVKKEINKYQVTSGRTRSCGCLAREVAREMVTAMLPPDAKQNRRVPVPKSPPPRRRQVGRERLTISVTRSHFRMNVRAARNRHGDIVSKDIIRKCYQNARAHATWWAFTIPTTSLIALRKK